MTLRVAQLSDTHISVNFPERTANMERCIEQINRAKPDIVVHTGDVAHDGLAEEYRTAHQLLDTLSAPYYVIPGNRDHRSEFVNVFADDKHVRASCDFIQYAIEDLPVRFVMLDTLSEKSNKGELCEARLTQFERLLAANTTKQTVVFMHHPPFEATEIPDPLQFQQWDDVVKFTAIIRKYQNVSAVYCGHVHRSIDDSVAGLPASAISCVAGDLRKGEVSEAERELAMFRVISFD